MLLIPALVLALPTTLEPMDITADLRERDASEITSSVTALDEEQLDEADKQHLQDVLAFVPNLSWAGGSSRPRYFQIRGIGERDQYQGAPNSSVGFLVDGIDFSGIGMVATLFDVQQIEVLRGPQGTRYGANALAGLINVQTREPSLTPDLRAEVTLGGDGTRAAGVAFGGPLGDDGAAYRLVLHQHQSDGFRDNVYLDRDDTNDRDELTSRLKLSTPLGDNAMFDATLMHVDIDNGYDAFAVDNGYTTYSDRPGRDAQRSNALSTELVYNGWQGVDLQWLAHYADSDIVYSFDGDWGNPDFWGEYAPYNFFSKTMRERQTMSQELRFSSQPGDGLMNDSISWVGGFYWLALEEDNQFRDDYNGAVYRDMDSAYEADNLAAYGQLDWALTDARSLIIGLRVEQREAEYADTAGISFTPDNTEWGGELAWHEAWTERTSTYVALSRGYKSGGFNISAAVPPERRQYGPELLWNLEAGLNWQSADKRVLSQLTLFTNKREDAQVETSFQDDPSDPLSFTYYTDNAASGSSVGAEASFSWLFADDWRLDLNAGLLNSEFDDYMTGTRVLDGRDFAHAPNWNYGARLSYDQGLGWFASADLTGQDGFYFSDSHDQRAEAYHLMNLRLGYRWAKYEIAAWGRNVFDEEYPVRGFYFGNEPPDYPNREYVRLGDPAIFGVSFKVQL